MDCEYVFRTAKNFGLREENNNIQTRRERPLMMAREREEGRRMQCFMKKDNKSLTDVENVETDNANRIKQ